MHGVLQCNVRRDGGRGCAVEQSEPTSVRSFSRPVLFAECRMHVYSLEQVYSYLSSTVHMNLSLPLFTVTVEYLWV